ncbi:hypothetical protein KOI35_42865 [Actinoplanes bogorensis]|uniref:Uncharacterized protein n=1 Tax=Paractinoplanes bogorensis TaxID=1610840 RepID=A0ABS5Z3K1_9ACTN|nr:hypothetical protein [Actinoplanes bogorensis]MBU2670265.1 hypothetical protein [Actinoplanes bogorensis]
MSIDFSYANPEAVDAVGILPKYDAEHGFENGWARSVIERWRTDYDGDIDWDDDEQALVDWYTDDVIQHDEWKAIVEQHNKDVTQEDNVTVTPYDEDNPPYDMPENTFEHPEDTEYSGGNNPNQELAVSTEALRHVANQIGAIVGLDDGGSNLILTARKQLGDIAMLPGGFAKAEVLRQKIEGVNSNDAGLRGDAMGLLLASHEALLAVKEGLLKIADSYDNAEEFNEMTTTQLGDNMGNAWGKIDGLADYGQSSGTTTGGNQ